MQFGFGGDARGLAMSAADVNTVYYVNNAWVDITTTGAANRANLTYASGPGVIKDWVQRYSHFDHCFNPAQTPSASCLATGDVGFWQSTGLNVTSAWSYVVHPNNPQVRFIPNTDMGLARSTDGGSTWQNIVSDSSQRRWTGFYELAFEDKAVRNPPRVWAAVSTHHDIPHDSELGVAAGTGAVLVSTPTAVDNSDAGAIFAPPPPCGTTANTLPAGPVVSLVYSNESGVSTLYASVWGDSGTTGGVFKSTDGGSCWSNLTSGSNTVFKSRRFYQLRFDGAGSLHVSVAASTVPAGVGGLYKYNGSQWQSLSDALGNVAPVDFVFDPARPGVIYLGSLSIPGYFGRGYKFTPSTGLWTIMGLPISGSVVVFAPALIADSSGKTWLYMTTSQGVFKADPATDLTLASSWTEYGVAPFQNAQRITQDPGNPGVLYVTMFGGGVYQTSATSRLTVSSQGTGSGSVTSSPAGIDCGATCFFDFDSTKTVTLTATADTGSRFVSFSGCDSTSGSTCTVAMSVAKSVTVTFNKQFNLTLTKSGTGTGNVTSAPAGISCGTTCTSQAQAFDSGTSVTLTATADTGSRFVSFSGCDSTSGTSCTVAMSAAKSVTVTFNKQYDLTVTKSGGGTGNVTSTPAGISCATACTSQVQAFDSGTSVTLSATADTNSSFGSFTGCDSTTGSTCTVAMSAAKSVTVTFTTTTLRLTVSKAGTGGGTVSSSPAGISCGSTCFANYATGTTVTLTAAPGANSTLAGFSSNCAPVSGNPNACTIALTANATVTATFNPIMVALTVSRAGAGNGGVSSSPAGINCGLGYSTCTASFTKGSSVTLTATPDAMSTFGAYSGGCTGSSATCTLTLNAATNVTATFLVAPSCSAPVFSDNFDRTTGLGASWTTLYGSFTTDGSAAVTGAPPVNGDWAFVSGPAATADYDIAADIVVPAGSLYSGIVARGSTSAFDRDLYAAQLGADGSINLYRRNAWTWTALATSSAPGTVVGTPHNLRLVAVGSLPVHLEVWLDGALAIAVDDSSSSRVLSGLAGIEAYDANVQFLSFSVARGPMFADRFTRTSGLGAGWQLIYGAYTTDGSGAVSGTPPINGNWAAVAQPLGSTNYSVASDISIPPGSASSGLAIRSSVPGAFDSDVYAAKLSTDGTVNLYRRNSWNWTQLDSVFAGIAANITYNLKLVATGSAPVHLEVWLNGVVQMTYDDGDAASLPRGGVGILNYSPGVRYGAFSVCNVATLTVTKSGTGTGLVRSQPPGINCGPSCAASYPASGLVTLTATPDSGMTFDGFSGACSTTQNTCTVAVLAAAAVNASFTDPCAPECNMSCDPNNTDPRPARNGCGVICPDPLCLPPGGGPN